MTENELKELNERLAKAVGVDIEAIAKSNYEKLVRDNRGKGFIGNETWEETCTKKELHRLYAIPNFTGSMDACIKWIVPSLKFTVDFHQINKNLWRCRINTSVSTCFEYRAESIPLAFCLASDKYFKEIGK